MKNKYILALDQGTTGSRAFLFDQKGRIAASAYQEFKQFFPKPGWVEHDPEEIWKSCVDVINEAMNKTGISPGRIMAVGITNQRETTVLWDRRTSKPVCRAIVWQCRRTSEMCLSPALKRYEPVFRKKTGLVLDPYFSGTKIKWCLDNMRGLRQRARKGDICFGTIDSWLVWKLTGGQSHVTDMTNASRTLIFNIRELAWDREILKILDIPPEMLPRVQHSGSVFGVIQNRETSLVPGTPITAVLGDQQAALYGQGCYESGTVKNTYGTGCFMMLNTGHKLVYSSKGLLSTVASDDQGRPVYALEGSVFIAGAVVQWLRDQLGLLRKSSDAEEMIQGLKDTQGVYFVPAFTGLGAPYWDSEARGVICGLTRGVDRKHIIRAALESIAYQTRDVFDILQKELKRNIPEMRVDGGACQNNFLMQFQADLLGCRLLRPRVIESTAQGAAQLAGVTSGFWQGKKDLAKLHKIERVFVPSMKTPERTRLYAGWLKAVAKARE
ncbi:MAG TPA: glycerol kinase [Candidatus Omnitrophica bacterium]|nr:MAG: glycerol kinase [Omnitrophica WOR_2 bacterium GWA2_45_18]HBR14105.1 glycerol kinase [Candidatus Omnitrophota bacterium]